MLRFEVYDVAGAFGTSDASKLSLKEQVRCGGINYGTSRATDQIGRFACKDTYFSPLTQASQGTVECALATIMGAHGQTVTRPLESPHLPNQRATITIRAEQAKHSSDLVIFELGTTGFSSNSNRYFCQSLEIFVLFNCLDLN